MACLKNPLTQPVLTLSYLILGLLGLIGCAGRQLNPIAIDVGHSRTYPGAISAQGTSEFEFNRHLANTLINDLNSRNIPCLIIGAQGDITDLRQRSAIANATEARFFLSIHHDSVQPLYLKTRRTNGALQHYSRHAQGFSVFISRQNPRLTTSLQCASAIGKALKAHGFRPSPHHAEPIIGEDKPWADQQNGVYYYDTLSVLKTTKMPAVLLEAGVIVNPEEESRLQQISTQQNLASAIVKGLSLCGIVPAQ